MIVSRQAMHESDKYLNAMQIELGKLKKDHSNPSDLDSFYELYKRFIETKENKIDWNKIEQPSGKLVSYSKLPEAEKATESLSKLAVLKLNGGLGTTMGCVGPKSAIQVRDGKNFIDVIMKQLNHLNTSYKCDIPLILMNSFNTDKRTAKLIKNYTNIKTFNQSAFPRISSEDLMPIDDDIYYPPGHGDLFFSIKKSGMLDELLKEGKEYLFVSNVDNLAATVDLKILQYCISENIDFCMEVTDKTRADIKGGTLVNINDKLTLLEIAQVPPARKSEFTSIRKFKIFNTNSIWINLKALKSVLEKPLELDIIQNKKMVNCESVIQLETAMGAAVKYFDRNCGIVVPRSRFLPVKACSDLFLLESNLYSENNGHMELNSTRISPHQPIVKLVGRNFTTITEYEKSFAGIPDIVDLDILTVSGDVTFGKNVVLKGIVIICATNGNRIDIPDGSILEDKILVGNLPITDV
ncbi:UTP--glucose-1-phosphate uridylyltransferase [Pancytospora epiphaga]|nr:UTP--glucose-1-phosphate uridylyltransferase [Pancytospora epiphaga]